MYTKTLLKHLKPFYPRMSLGLFIKFVATMLELMLPVILSHILKNVVAKQSLRSILLWGGLMIGLAGSACISNIVANRMSAKVARDFSEGVRKDLFEKTLRLSASQTDYFSIPSLESRITTDTYNVHNFVNSIQRIGVRAPILLLGGILITFVMDAYLALIMVAVLPLLFIVVNYISRKGIPLYSGVQRSIDGMVQVVREDTQGIRVIKALSKNNYENNRFDQKSKKLSKDERHAGIIMGSVNPIMTLTMNLGIAAVVAMSASRVSRGLSSPETVIAFMQYFTLISTSLLTVSRIFVMYTKCAASANRIAEVLNMPEDIKVISKTRGKKCDTDGYIVFQNVSLSYFGKTKQVDNLSFSVRKGGQIGFIGATGSGKTSVIRLLLRLYDPTSGNIFIDGRDIRTIPKDEFTNMFGIVFQNDFLYADTIEENIMFGRDLSKDEIEKATKTAQAYDFITNFSEGFERKLSSKATNVSGGQKQRILISRAVAKNPPILILDDSSSALDYRTDAALRKALKENMSSSTVITVAQRVSSIKHCDTIIVLDNGKVIGQGTHEELLESCPEYKEISDSQMGGALID